MDLTIEKFEKIMTKVKYSKNFQEPFSSPKLKLFSGLQRIFDDLVSLKKNII